ncbi:hypothetical protein JTB14_031148 [Gonioctena quinquepunctata]|nr:hypothetical protein JTB14_031148 [Gonioctena quinquepunctata]
MKESLSTIGAETGNPFSRRDSIQRTPPRTPSGSRTSSISSLSDIQDKDKPEESPLLKQSVKRKKNNPSPEPKKRNEVKDRGDILKTTIERMMNQIEKLNRVVKEMYKPKQEVKEVASRLALHAEQLKNKELMRWLGEVDKENRVSESEQKWRNENECLRQHIQAMEESHRNDHRGRSTAGTQCQECRKESQKKERRDGLTQHLNFETFQMITEVDWGNEIFPKMNVESGHIWEAPNEYDIILPCNAKFGSQKMRSHQITKLGEDGSEDKIKPKGMWLGMPTLGFFQRED